MPKKTEETVSKFDLFAWANRAEQHKKQFKIELFAINKHFTPFRLNLSQELEAQAKAIFLHDMVNFVNQGVETGLEVTDFESAEADKNSVQRVGLEKVERASYLMNFFKDRQAEITDFTHEEYDFRIIKAIAVRCTLEGDEVEELAPFYIVKQLSASQAVMGATAWQLEGSKVKPLAAEVALKVPLDNQVLLASDQIFIFNQSKFERLFSYDFKKIQIAKEKIKAIEERFQLSLPDGLTIQSIVRDRKKTLAKLQKLEMTTMSQEELIDYADEMALELMTDEQGAIIILDGNDLDTFLGLLNEDYMLSTVTNNRYEITAKKMLGEADGGEPPRG